MDIQIRPPKREECDALVQMGQRTGVFSPGEAQELLGQTLFNLLNEKLPFQHKAYVLVHEKINKGWVYFGPTQDSVIWNLWWIGVDPNFMGHGFGKRLLRFVEETVKSDGASHLIIETSSSDLFIRTREFYKLQGYSLSHIEPDNYGHGEDKIIFKKKLQNVKSDTAFGYYICVQ